MVVAVFEKDAGLAEKEAVAVTVGGADCDRLTLALRLSDADTLRGELVRDGDLDRESSVALLMLGDAERDSAPPLRERDALTDRDGKPPRLRERDALTDRDGKPPLRERDALTDRDGKPPLRERDALTDRDGKPPRRERDALTDRDGKPPLRERDALRDCDGTPPLRERDALTDLDAAGDAVMLKPRVGDLDDDRVGDTSVHCT